MLAAAAAPVAALVEELVGPNPQVFRDFIRTARQAAFPQAHWKDRIRDHATQVGVEQNFFRRGLRFEPVALRWPRVGGQIPTEGIVVREQHHGNRNRACRPSPLGIAVERVHGKAIAGDGHESAARLRYSLRQGQQHAAGRRARARGNHEQRSLA